MGRAQGLEDYGRWWRGLAPQAKLSCHSIVALPVALHLVTISCIVGSIALEAAARQRTSARELLAAASVQLEGFHKTVKACSCAPHHRGTARLWQSSDCDQAHMERQGCEPSSTLPSRVSAGPVKYCIE